MPKIGEPGAPKPGRKKGSVNRTTALLKDAIIEAAVKAGNKGGLVGYLHTQANENPVAFMTLLGKVMPLQVQGADGQPILAGLVVTIVDPSKD